MAQANPFFQGRQLMTPEPRAVSETITPSSSSRASERRCSRRIRDSRAAPPPHGAVRFGRWVFYLLTTWWFWNTICRIGDVCYLQYSPAATHTHYGIAEQKPGGKGIESAAGNYVLIWFLGHCCAYGGTRGEWEEQLFPPRSKTVGLYRGIILVIPSSSIKQLRRLLAKTQGSKSVRTRLSGTDFLVIPALHRCEKILRDQSHNIKAGANGEPPS